MITYLKGDATRPIGEGKKIICHICNNYNKWGAGFVMALSRRWSKIKPAYHQYNETSGLILGHVQFVKVEDDIVIANMIGQHNIYPINNIPPIRYDAVANCLEKVAVKAKELKASVHAPRFGCGLAGGEWSKIEPIIKDKLDGIQVYVYDL